MGFHEGGFHELGAMKEPAPFWSTSGQYASSWNAFLFHLISYKSHLLMKDLVPIISSTTISVNFHKLCIMDGKHWSMVI